MEKQCRQCGSGFEIAEADRELYEKVSPIFGGQRYLLLMPEFCPDCRQRERVAFRNESTLYKRKCDLTGKDIVSTYHDGAPYKVYSQDAFWSDDWSAFDFGRDFDLNKPFFEQFSELMAVAPRLSIVNKQSQNSDYCNFSFSNKNCYLLFGSHYEEDCLYGGYSTKNRTCMDYFWIYGSELCYECTFCNNCYHCVFVERSEECSDCYFCYDMKSCHDCLFSHGLRNKQYYIFNEQKSKEEYGKYFDGLKLSSYSQFEKLKEGWEKFRKGNAIYRHIYQVNCQNCEGTNHQNSKNLKYCFACTDCEDCIYGFQMDQTYSSIDNSQMGYDRCELCYNTVGHNGTFHGFCCDSCWHCSDIFYCNLCFSSRDCFGCIGMRQNQYCILNKQYSKDEYHKLAARIAEHMIKTEEWGRFFPPELRPYAYNESVANEYFPMTKEEILKSGWRFKEEIDQFEERSSDYQIPDDISGVGDDIADKALTCSETGRPYKVVSKELAFYRKMNLPVARISPKERLRRRFQFKAQHKIKDRKCDRCSVILKTVYSTEVAEKVYCDQCYKQEIY